MISSQPTQSVSRFGKSLGFKTIIWRKTEKDPSADIPGLQKKKKKKTDVCLQIGTYLCKFLYKPVHTHAHLKH